MTHTFNANYTQQADVRIMQDNYRPNSNAKRYQVVYWTLAIRFDMLFIVLAGARRIETM